ncbi:hypothetical protein EVAR_49605_1 [Eumeta japonica]|uniref:Uncharacterized protein n=1 Tax=Eumeta variegata TaxID=151549 RepID=A0A4C1Y0D0_EUMVA|nr:hypothetical protein EVAR_49605_1 [Eumeta japonica]
MPTRSQSMDGARSAGIFIKRGAQHSASGAVIGGLVKESAYLAGGVTRRDPSCCRFNFGPPSGAHPLPASYAVQNRSFDPVQYKTRNSAALNCLRMMQYAGPTLLDPCFFSPLPNLRYCDAFATNFTAAEFHTQPYWIAKPLGCGAPAAHSDDRPAIAGPSNDKGQLGFGLRRRY